MNKKSLLKILTPLLTTLSLVGILELGLSFSYGENESYIINSPGLEYQYNFNSKYVKNMSSLINVKINSLGARSAEITDNYQEKIVAIGGSTTECNTTNQPLTWTEIVQQTLTKNIKKDFWVGNFGKSGTTSEHHILQTQELFKMKELADVKTVIYLIGFNDALKALHYPKRYLNTSVLELKKKAFSVYPDRELPYWKRNSIFKFIKEKRFQWQLKLVDKDIFDKRYRNNKDKRKQIKWQDELPNLSKQISAYKENIRTIISINVTNNKTPIFITQPVLWDTNLDTRLKDLLVFDLIETTNYSPDTLALLMKLFNTALIEVCEEKSIKYIDLANQSNQNWFYDDCHFNLIGNEKVGEFISQELETLLNK
ncbi:SGNH/GDSL hydrolase family protein [uncultured Arcticibacterium sp.]|uniref:SGNH/GDSL hydrolase family protein n=1 Tax=uncultured Arcticibacterium sp. TaxID=2173042 RepID=UPI0030F8689D